MGQAPMGSASMGQAPMGQAGPASGSARVGGSASVPGSFAPPPPPAPTTYGAAPQQAYPAQSGVYGQPMGSGQYGNQPPPPSGQPFGQPSGGPAGAPPAFGPAQGSPMGQAYGQPSYSSPPPPPPASAPDAGRQPNVMPQAGGWPHAEDGEQPRKSRKGLTIALIVIAILAVAGVGSYVGLKLATRADVYVVGACVRQDGTEAAIVECGASGAYKITQLVDNESQCPDATQPSLLVTAGGKTQVACLGPAQ
jgi:hypothetical protein